MIHIGQCMCGKHIIAAAAPTGWTCPACGKGNAPDVKGCVHCAATLTTSNIEFSLGRAGVMDPGG